MNWEACTKSVLIISLILAELTQGALATKDPLVGLAGSAVALLGSLFAARLFPRATLWSVLLVVYIWRGLLLLLLGHISSYHTIPLTSCLLGIILARPNFRTWDLPQSWKFPLIFWGLIVALTWPILLLRELDFSPALTLGVPLFNNGNGVSTKVAALWVVRTAVTQGVGFLWIDWLFRTFRREPQGQFQRHVLVPLAISFILTSCVAYYQAFVDLSFLSSRVWLEVHRAVGALMDGNAFGILAAYWITAFVVLGMQKHPPTSKIIAALLVLLAIGALLLAGSTSALLMAGFPLVFVFWATWKGTLKASKRTVLTWSLGSLCALVGLIWGIASTSNVVNPFEKLLSQTPPSGEYSFGSVIKAQLRDRPFFASLAARMALEAPLTGTGLGSFHTLANDYAYKYGLADTLNFDSALNWYAQQAAELGILGCLGWGSWLSICFWSLVRPRPPPEKEISVGLLQTSLVGFGVAALFGVHAEGPEVLISFWTFLFWLSSYFPQLSSVTLPGKERRTLWVLVIGIALAYTALQGYVSLQTLRVPYRAVIANWDYEYGFSNWQHAPGIGKFRWTQHKAVAVVPVQGSRLHLTLQVRHPDVTTNPVHVWVWKNEELVADLWVHSHKPLVRDILLPDGKQRIVLTIQVDRTWRPSGHGGDDARQIGVAVAAWSFS